LADAFRGLRESGGLLGPPLIDQADATARQRVVVVVCLATFMGSTIGLRRADCNDLPEDAAKSATLSLAAAIPVSSAAQDVQG